MNSQSFRSNIMRQLLATARHQSRPPMALMGWLNELADEEAGGVRSPPPHRHLGAHSGGSAPADAGAVRTLSTSNGSVTSRAGPRSRAAIATTGPDEATTLHAHKSNSTSSRYLSVAAASHASDDDHHHLEELELPQLFQRLIQTRRSRSHFASLSEASAVLGVDRNFWVDALDRAALCGYSAPNHRRTEPFTFKRILAPSDKASQLAEIAYRVSLRQQREMDDGNGTHELEESQEASARRKRDKWSQIPAFLVTTVASQRSLIDPVAYATALERTPFTPLPFAPLQTDREMEDYASACAAVQNVLLSLHAEGIASKWATGPIVQTPAFRELVDARPEDRVVALVMVGLPDVSRKAHRRRHHRDLHGDVLVDL